MADYAISTWLLGHLPREEAIRLLAEEGFTNIELSSAWSALVGAWENDPAGVVAELTAAGLTVDSIHNPSSGRSLDSPDDEERRASIEHNLRYIDLMQRSGIPEIVIHPVSGAAGQDDDAWAAVPARSRESLSELAKVAGQAGVRLAVENVGRNNRPGSSIASVLELIDGLGDHVGLCMDIGHSQQAGLDLLAELSTGLRSGKLFTLHLHDVDPNGKDHYVPGEGCLDLDPFLDMLDAHDFAGGRTLEISPVPAEEVPERLRQVAAVRDQWQSR